MTKTERWLLGLAVVFLLLTTIAGVGLIRSLSEARSEPNGHGPFFVVVERGVQPLTVRGLDDQDCRITTDIEGCSIVECVEFPSMRGTTIARTCRGAITRAR